MAITYISVNDASKYLKTSKRAVQGRCKRNNISQRNGVYKIPLNTINTWLYDKGFSLIGQDLNTNIANTQNDVRIDMRIEDNNIDNSNAAIKLIPTDSDAPINLKLHNQVEDLKKQNEKLNEDVTRYREVLVAHGRIMKNITDKLEDLSNGNVNITTKETTNRNRTPETFFKTTVKNPKPEFAAAEYSEAKQVALNKKLEKQFGYGVKHISINKEVPNENAMNEVGFGTRLHHLNKLEDMYPTSKNMPSGKVDSEVTISKLNEDGVMKTTTEKTTDDLSK